MSSKTRTSGCVRASPSKKRRTAQNPSPHCGPPPQTDQLGHALRDPLRPLDAFEQVGDPAPRLLGRALVGDTRRPADGLGHRPVCDALAVGKTASSQDGPSVAELAEGFQNQPRLPDAGLAEEVTRRHDAAGDRAVEGVEDRAELQLPPDHRRVEPAGAGLGPGDDPLQPMGGTGSALPFASIGSTGSATTASRTRR